MAESQPSSRRSCQSHQSAGQAPHNSDHEQAEFLANQPNLVATQGVRSIPVNPCLQMHSLSLHIYSSTIFQFDFFYIADVLRARKEHAARKAAKKI